MRSERDVYGELLGWALEDDNIRAIILNGSRSDPTRTPDDLSDYDAAVFVQELDAITDGSWLGRFGDVIVRWPLTPQPTLEHAPESITQLVLFRDGVRIDFQFYPSSSITIERAGPFHCVLFDRDGLTESLSGVPVGGAVIEPPTIDEFADRINAFWWDVPYVAKALRRGEIDNARYIMEADLRFEKIHPLIRWHIGARHGWQTDTGIFGRWFPRYLEPEIWGAYLETFSGAAIEDQWRAMFAMMEFVRALGNSVASAIGFRYPSRVDERVTQYIRSIGQTRADRN